MIGWWMNILISVSFSSLSFDYLYFQISLILHMNIPRMNILRGKNQHCSLGLIFNCFHLIFDILLSPIFYDKYGQLPEFDFKRPINGCSVSYWGQALECAFLLLIHNRRDCGPRKCKHYFPFPNEIIWLLVVAR